jgi:hypothetical protein
MAHTCGRVLRTVTDNRGAEWVVVEPLTASETKLRREHRGLVASGAVTETFDRWMLRRAFAAVERRRKRGADPAVKPMHRVERSGDQVIRVDCTIPAGECGYCSGMLS